MKLYCATTNPGKLREFRLAVERLEPRLVIEEIALAGAAGHEQFDDAPGAGPAAVKDRRRAARLLRREHRAGDPAQAAQIGRAHV